MPKATVHKHQLPMSRKNDIRLTRQFFRMKPEAAPHPVQHRTHRQLWLGVATPYPSHIFATMLGRETVHRLDGEVERKIGDILELFSSRHDVQRLQSILQRLACST